MARLIDADELLKYLNVMYDRQNDDDEPFNCAVLAMSYHIKEAPTIEVPTWIPCSERLPTEEEQDINLGVLVTLGNGYKGMDFDWYHDGRWYDWGRCVIAWMPLPKPYEETDHE